MAKETIIGIERAIKIKKAKKKKYSKNYQRLKNSKFCMSCGKKEKEPNHVRCKECREKMAEEYRKNSKYQNG